MKNIFRALLLIFTLTVILASLALPAFAQEEGATDTAATDTATEAETETAEEVPEGIIVAKETDEKKNLILVFEDGKKYNVTKQEWVEETQDGGMQLKFDPANMVASLQYMWQGMLCIFVVMAVIIISVYLIGFLSAKAEERRKLREGEDDSNG